MTDSFNAHHNLEPAFLFPAATESIPIAKEKEDDKDGDEHYG